MTRQKCLSPEMEEWERDALARMEHNPMRRLLGPGPEGALCKSCVHLRCLRYANRYYKCDLRNLAHGPATDQRVNWKACAKWEKSESLEGKP